VHVTETVNLSDNPHELTGDSLHMKHIEQLTVMMYSKNSSDVELTVSEQGSLCSFIVVNLQRKFHPQKLPCTIISMLTEMFSYHCYLAPRHLNVRCAAYILKLKLSAQYCANVEMAAATILILVSNVGLLHDDSFIVA